MATTRVFYKGKKELTMAQFEALTSLDDAIDYDITDFPNGGITNAQMTAALGYSRLFEDGEIYVCSDDGTYTKGNLYQIKVESGVKSWVKITKNLKIYTITENLNYDGIKSGIFTEEQMNNIKLADILEVYGIDGDPIYKYAYKGLFPTNSAQSTVFANLYFAVATEKGNYVLAIHTDTRNWEVREPDKGNIKTVVYDNTTLSAHISEILGYVNTENGGNLISIKAKIGNTAITGSRKVVTTTTSSGAISVESGEGTIINAGEMIMLTPGAIRNGANGKKATFICANDTDNHSNANVDISNLESTNKAVLSGIEFGYLNDNIVQIYYQNINILDAQLEHLVIDYFTI